LSVPPPQAFEATLDVTASRTGVKDALLRSTLRLQSDEKLVELLRQGHAPAFDVMVERYRLPLTRYCARMVGADNADDIVQETFTASYSALGSDDRPIQLKPWLYRVAHNTAISALRKKSRHEHEELDENFDGVRQPHDHLEQSQRLHDLVANMRALPERQRTALVLQELEGLSPEEIADELDGSVPMVRQLVHRARERLRNGVAMLIPLPLILKLFRADTASAATGKSAGAATATAKPAGMTVAGVGVTGTGAKVAVVLALAALAGGGVGAKQVLSGSTEKLEPASASQQVADDVTPTGPETARISTSRSARGSAGSGAASAPSADGVTPSTDGSAGDSERSTAGADDERGGNGTDTPGMPEQTDDASPPSGGGSDDSPAPGTESPSRSGGGSGGGSAGGGQPSGGDSQPSGGGSQPSSGGGGGSTPPSGGGEGSTPPSGGGGGGTPPSGGGGGSTPSCKPILGIPLPLICLGK
jgi:RNA polymerase sigma factor (sigma-70 family)